MNDILEWTFIAKSKLPETVEAIFASNEEHVASYKTIRDTATFTTKRLIVRDSQGFTGTKVEMFSIPYSSINMWSTENAGILKDLDGEVTLWTRGGTFKIKLRKGIDVREFERVIAEAIF